MGYEALEVSDWIRLDFQVGNATVDFRFHWSILCPICGSYVTCFILSSYGFHPEQEIVFRVIFTF